MAKTIVALFDDMNHAQMAVRELQDNGFSREDISMVASDTTRERGMETGAEDTGEAVATGAIGGAGVGAALGGAAGLLVGLGALTIPGIGPIIAAGPLAAALAGAGIGAVAGGLVGALIGLGVPEDEAGYYAEGVRRGGTLVTVRSEDMRADLAAEILNRHDPVNVRERVSTWREEGWTGFNPDAEPFGREDWERERARYGGTSRTDEDLVTGMGGTDRGRTDFERTDYGRGTHETGGTYRTSIYDTSETHTGTRGYGDTADFDMYEPDFRRHFDTSYGTRGYRYETYRPAYLYGYNLHRMSDCNGDCRWEDMEMQARRDWERDYPDNPWEEFKDAIREGWNALTGR